MSRRNRVVYTDPGGRGWATVESMARLLARCLDADFVKLATRPRVDRARRALAPLTRRSSSGTCVVVAPQPAHLGSLVTAHAVVSGYERVVGWVVDSWLDDRIPRMAKHTAHYDHIFITDAELVDRWGDVTGAPTHWLPFGSDVLDQPALPPERPVDLLRVGRQPDEWADDAVTADDARRLGLAFSPGPPLLPDARANQASLMAAMRGAKATLSFTNLVSPAVYTHPTRDYVTGRWTDALASGATVAGVPPRCEAGKRLLWDSGLVLLPGTSRADGLERIVEFVGTWTPEHSAGVRRRALETLDWRVRFRELAATTGIRSSALDDEVARWQGALERDSSL